MFTGNLLALRQTNLKRLLAYSSIAHMGYLLITFLVGTADGIQAAIFYVVSYLITTLGAFGVISLLSSETKDTDEIGELKGFFQRNPWIAIVISLLCFHWPGFRLLQVLLLSFTWFLKAYVPIYGYLPFSLVINTVISIYYYLRVIKTMFTPSELSPYASLPLTGNIVLIIVTIGILLLGLLPSFLTGLIDNFILQQSGLNKRPVSSL